MHVWPQPRKRKGELVAGLCDKPQGTQQAKTNWPCHCLTFVPVFVSQSGGVLDILHVQLANDVQVRVQPCSDGETLVLPHLNSRRACPRVFLKRLINCRCSCVSRRRSQPGGKTRKLAVQLPRALCESALCLLASPQVGPEPQDVANRSLLGLHARVARPADHGSEARVERPHTCQRFAHRGGLSWLLKQRLHGRLPLTKHVLQGGQSRGAQPRRGRWAGGGGGGGG